MIRILVVDDNQLRVSSIKKILSDSNIHSSNVQYVDSVMEAKREIFKTHYDLMLLDLVLPTRPGESPQASAGIDLLHEIVYLDTYKLPQNVFIISEYDDALQKLSDIERKLSYATIKYEASSEEWRSRLQNYLDQLIRVDTEHLNDYDYDIAIVCALASPELFEIKQLPFNWEPLDILGDSTSYFTGTYNDKRIVCASSYEMGMSAAAILSTKMISRFRPKYLVMTGIAGGADKEKLNFGDVMVADPCFDYGSGKRVLEDGKSVFKPDFRQIRLDDSVTKVVQNISSQKEVLSGICEQCTYEKPENSLQIKIGPFGSGAAVVTDTTIIDQVTEHSRKFLGFDMEAYGVMLAGYISNSPKTTPIVMKSVSDFGDGKDDRYQKYASYTSAQVLKLLITHLPY